MIDKFKTCKDCPDRCVSPNCHNDCEGYLDRINRNREIAEKRKQALAQDEFDITVKLKCKKISNQYRRK